MALSSPPIETNRNYQTMRILFALLVCFSSLPVLAADSAALTSARSLADQGAWATAWNLVHENAPTADQAEWPAWEGLRQSILSQLSPWPPEARSLLDADLHGKNVDLQKGALDLLIKEAQQRGDQNRVRQQALEALTRFPEAGAQALHWREAIIDSYSAEGREHEAFVAMLRYQQDANPLPKPLVVDFVGRLLAMGAENDARLWAGQLPAGHPYQLWFAWRLNALPTEQVIAYARQFNAKKPDPRYWQVIAAASPTQSTQQLDAQEHLLGQTLPNLPGTPTLESKKLWDRLIEQGRVLGMQAQLITGDDQPWLDSAEQRSANEATEAECLLAYVSEHGRSASTRGHALARLFQLLDRDQLYAVSLALATTAPDDKLSPTARYFAGLAAMNLKQFDTANQLWQDLNKAPAEQGKATWLSWHANAAAHGNNPEAAVNDLQTLAQTHTPFDADTTARILDTVQHLPPTAQTEAAFVQLIPTLNNASQAEAYAKLGSVRLRQNNLDGAADALLRAIALKPEGANSQEWRSLALLALDEAGNTDEAGRLRQAWAPHPVVAPHTAPVLKKHK